MGLKVFFKPWSGELMHSLPLKEIPQNIKGTMCLLMHVCLLGSVCIRSASSRWTVCMCTCLVGSFIHSPHLKYLTTVFCQVMNVCLVGSVCIRSALFRGTVCMCTCLVGSFIHSPPLKEIPHKCSVCSWMKLWLVWSLMHSLPLKEMHPNTKCTKNALMWRNSVCVKQQI